MPSLARCERPSGAPRRASSDQPGRFAHGPELREAIARTTDDLIRRVDLVLTVNEQLTARARRLQGRVHTVINATNMRPRPAGHALPPSVQALARSLTKPVLGYAGFINQHRIDLELVGELARRQPGCTLLFIGPIRDDFRRRFPSLPNIRFLPPVPYDALQDYLALFDVCLIPHLDNPHTAGNNPLKLYDYLTTGQPVVSTRIAGLEGFEDVVAVAESAPDFLAAVDRVLAEDTGEARGRRLARAAEQHWSRRVHEVAAALEAALGRGGGAGDGQVAERSDVPETRVPTAN